VFVVDRDEWGRATLGRLLRAQGYQVVPCASARELLLYLGQGGSELAYAPSVALVNSHTLGEDTLDIVHALHAGRHGARVVVLTDFSDDEDVIAFLRAGASDYLRLPVDPETVCAVVERVRALPLVG
jgi:DNA-binding response OmpR family regulator